MLLVTDRTWPPEAWDAVVLECDEIGVGRHWTDRDADDEERYGDHEIRSQKRREVVVHETPRWQVVAVPDTHEVLFGNGPDSESYQTWNHEARATLVGPVAEVVPLTLDTGKIIDSDEAMALVALLDAGFRPDASWVRMDTMPGSMLRTFDAIRRVDAIPDGDEKALLAASARRMIADATKEARIYYGDGSKTPHTLVHNGFLYLFRPVSREEFVICPNGEWRAVERHTAHPLPRSWRHRRTRLAEPVARFWIELGCPTAATLLGKAPKGNVSLDENLPTLCLRIATDLNFATANRDVALVALRIALSENWPQPRAEQG